MKIKRLVITAALAVTVSASCASPSYGDYAAEQAAAQRALKASQQQSNEAERRTNERRAYQSNNRENQVYQKDMQRERLDTYRGMNQDTNNNQRQMQQDYINSRSPWINKKRLPQ